jgi:hypothetical protein
MPSRSLFALTLVGAALLACHTPPAPASGAPPEATLALTSASTFGGDGVAVVELFTSEGCSSCPSADAVLGDIVRAHDPRVFPLAFHVDYWNSLGWPDRFSTSDRTDRQRLYAGAFGTGSVYTPQMIVGGVEQFTGSDASHAAESVAHALRAAPSARLTLTPEATGPRDVVVHFHTESAPEGAWVNVAVAEKGLVTHVLAGENRGRTLPHENVVRAFGEKKLGGDSDGAVLLSVPADVDRSRAEVIGYVQASAKEGVRGMPILAAARVGAPGGR